MNLCVGTGFGAGLLLLTVFTGLAGAVCFTLALTGVVAFVLDGAAAARVFVGAAFFDFGAPADCFRAGREAFAAGTDFFGAALRTGAFSAAERFGLGLGRADLTLSLRLAEDFEEALPGAGREVFLFAPLITGSLMRSTQVFTDGPD